MLAAIASSLSAAHALPQTGAALLLAGDPLRISAPEPLLEPGDAYVWKKDGKVLPSATEPEFFTSEAALLDAGAYSLFARRGGRLVELVREDIAVVDGRIRGPVSGQIARDKAFKLRLVVAGRGLGFQWYRDDVEMPGETASELNVRPPNAESTYFCRVTRDVLSVDSGYFGTILISEVPNIGQEEARTVIAGAPFSLFVTADREARFHLRGPAGLRLDESWGPQVAEIKGTIHEPGAYRLQIWGTNVVGAGPVMVVPLTVKPFPSVMAGTFAGSIPAGNGATDRFGGVFRITVTKRSACSGKIMLGTHSLSFAGSFDLVTEQMAIKGIGELDAEAGPVHCDINVYSIDGRTGCDLILSGALGVAACTGNKFIPAEPVLAGRYNASVAIWRPWEMTDATPNGFGFAALRLDRSGHIAIAGRLPDGDAFTQHTIFTDASGLGTADTGVAPIYQLLYGGAGALSGSIGVGRSDDFGGTCFGELSYGKTATDDGGPYAAGWDPVGVMFNGAKYNAPAAGRRVLGIAKASPNSQFRFEGGELFDSIIQPFTMGVKDYQVTPVPGVTDGFYASINPQTGLITGAFMQGTADDSPLSSAPYPPPTVRFMGLLLPFQQQGLGFFLTRKGGRTGQMFFDPLALE